MGVVYTVKVRNGEGSSSHKLKSRVSIARWNLKEGGGKLVLGSKFGHKESRI